MSASHASPATLMALVAYGAVLMVRDSTLGASAQHQQPTTPSSREPQQESEQHWQPRGPSRIVVQICNA
jgi:hypothetical protein